MLPRSISALAATIAALASAPSAAGAALGSGAWQGPQTVAREAGTQFSSVAAALAADGRGLVVWASRRPQFAITAVDVAPDGSLGRPVALSPAGDRASAPLVGTAADGEAIVAWRTGRGARGVSLCIRAASGGPCVVQRISPPGRRAVLQSLAVDVDGSAVVAWLQRTGAGWRAAIAERAAAERFGPARLVGPAGATAAQVALGPGTAALAFSRARGGRGSEVRLATWLRGEAPALTHAVSPPSHVAAAPSVALDARENAVVAWQRVHGANRFAIAYARFRDCERVRCLSGPGALEVFGPLRRLGPRLVGSGHQASTGELTVSAAQDRIVLAWIHLAGDDRSPTQIRAAQWSHGSLGAALRVSDPRYGGFDPQVVAAAERTVVIYREYGRPGVRDGLAVARVAEAGSLGFGPLAALSSPQLIQQSVGHPRLALAPSGAALVVFTDYGADGSGAGEVALARLPGA